MPMSVGTFDIPPLGGISIGWLFALYRFILIKSGIEIVGVVAFILRSLTRIGFVAGESCSRL